MTTPHTPPTQAELDAAKEFGDNHGYLRDYMARPIILEVERLTKEVEEFRAKQAEHENNTRILKSCLRYGQSPCGHSEQFAYSQDGGKNIICLECRSKEVEELRKDKERLDACLARKRIRIQKHEYYNTFNHEHVWKDLFNRNQIDVATAMQQKGEE